LCGRRSTPRTTSSRNDLNATSRRRRWAAHELSVGVLDIPPRGSYQQRDLERALRSLEFEIEFVNAQLEAAKDEEGDDLRGMLHAEMRGITARTSILSTMLGGRPGE
jgi:hypothetical protein